MFPFILTLGSCVLNIQPALPPQYVAIGYQIDYPVLEVNVGNCTYTWIGWHLKLGNPNQ